MRVKTTEMKIRSLNRKVVLITGASTGVGLALVKLLRSTGEYHIVATARETSLLRFAEHGLVEDESLWLRALDVLKKKERDQLFSEIHLKLGGVDVLVNNAAYMLRAVVEHVGEVERFKQMETNFRAPMALIRSVLPTMRQKRSGHIINISSVGGTMAMPTMSVYSASKFALEGASEALWYEVRPWNISVTLVQPGFINSESHMNVKQSRECLKALKNQSDPYFNHYNSMVPFINHLMRFSSATPEKVALVILKNMNKKRPPLRVSATWDAHFFSLLRRLLPRRLYHGLLYRMLPEIEIWGRQGDGHNPSADKTLLSRKRQLSRR